MKLTVVYCLLDGHLCYIVLNTTSMVNRTSLSILALHPNLTDTIIHGRDKLHSFSSSSHSICVKEMTTAADWNDIYAYYPLYPQDMYILVDMSILFCSFSVVGTCIELSF
jgi:hypothetical protein